MQLRAAAALAVALALLGTLHAASAQTVLSPFNSAYQVVNLGSAFPPMQGIQGGLFFLPGDNAHIYMAGNANAENGDFWRVPVVRGVNGHITGFTAGGSQRLRSMPFNDAGIALTPANGIMWARWPSNGISQTSPLPGGLTNEAGDRNKGNATGENGESVISLAFVPPYIPAAAGRLKIASYFSGFFFDQP